MFTSGGYTAPALSHARNSPYKILLTDIYNLREELSSYLLQETENILKKILDELEESKKRENKMYKAFVWLDRRVKELKNQNSNQDNIIYFLLEVITSCILLFLFYRFL